ncbi:s-adenosyl-l-methionine-dependent methyltransferase [Diplodia corticola]|uniref:S-adenosyl-l-methionine-dependent methyltransferase n=1 Tax=Diplodia corticola TaxID=236234 RepID=A0A1J9RW02_9PEZI|nr:s-adenosyl-l-methionine-dependent methyltransferase [Diplodia corticola]OJD32020.1 s-adenosyl-l-methionine-dependent methyltransferase [Diplodia corticola]
MASSTTRFDQVAAAWEADPTCRRSCELAYTALMQHTPQLQPGAKKPDVMEVECGSGILSAMLAPHAHTLTGTDTSEAMVAAFNANAAARGADHTTAVRFEINNPDFTAAPAAVAQLIQRVDGKAAEEPVRWDLLFCSTLAHQLVDMKQWLQIGYFCLAPGGSLVMVDVDNTAADAALFRFAGEHGDVAMPGLKPDEMEKLLEGAGYEDVLVKRVFSMERAVDPKEAGGRTSIELPFVLCRGTKPLR